MVYSLADMEDLHFMRLWDLYHPMLTETQQEICNLYFNCDLSLAEIAEEKGCSRQSISDCLQICRKKVEEYEEKLHFSRMLTEVCLEQSFRLTDITRWAEKANLTAEQKTEVQALIEREYEAEVAQAIEEHADTLL